MQPNFPTSNDSPGTGQLVRGAVCMVLSGLCFATMNLLIRLAGDVPTFQKSVFRNGVVLIIAWIIYVRSADYRGFRVAPSCRKSLWLRAVCGTVGLLCNFYAVDHLPIADASVLGRLSPFFAIIFSMFILAEQVDWVQITSILIALVGAGLVARPTFDNPNIVAYMIAIVGAVGAGAAYTYVRKLTLTGMNKHFIIFFFAAFSTVVIAPILIFTYEPMTWRQTLLLLGAGLCAAGGQYGVTFAYSLAPAKNISIFSYSQVIIAAILSMLVLHEFPYWLSIIGYVVIFGATFVLFIHNYRASAEA
ncbi:MAG: DMT family transporter [Saccharofermentanales bacterium]|jgi:drug/metabolite transporter (DMT)-like permease